MSLMKQSEASLLWDPILFVIETIWAEASTWKRLKTKTWLRSETSQITLRPIVYCGPSHCGHQSALLALQAQFWTDLRSFSIWTSLSSEMDCQWIFFHPFRLLKSIDHSWKPQTCLLESEIGLIMIKSIAWWLQKSQACSTMREVGIIILKTAIQGNRSWE